ncbi:MAG: hypothetical protein AB8U44_01705 [Aaplasma endosymbiont of Hyalomma asiaticum]
MNFRVLTFHGGGGAFFDAVVRHVTLHDANTLVVPNDQDVVQFQAELAKQHGVRKFAEIYSFSGSIAGYSDTSHCGKHRSSMLFMQFIEEWNGTRGANYSVEFAKELCVLLEELCLNCVSLEELCSLLEDEKFPEKCKVTPEFFICLARWLALSGADVTTPFSYTCAVDSFLKNLQQSPCRRVVVAGVVFNNLFLTFLKALAQNIPESIVILPCVDLSIPESKWQALDEQHHQYYFMKLLKYLGVSREEVREIEGSKRSKVVDLLFNFEIPTLSSYTCDSSGYRAHNIKLVTCKSESEELSKIEDILRAHSGQKNEQYRPGPDDTRGFRYTPGCEKEKQLLGDIWQSVASPRKTSVVFIESDTLALRMRTLLSLKDFSKMQYDVGYVVSSLLLSVVDVILNGGNSVHLLALLKHPLVTLGYKAEEYRGLISKFETDIIRRKAVSGFEVIGNIIETETTTPEIFCFWHNVTSILGTLRGMICGRYSLSELKRAHIACIKMLVDSSSKHEEEPMHATAFCDIERFFSLLSSCCTGKKVFSLQSYHVACKAFLESIYTIERNRLSTISFLRGNTVIVSGFNEGEEIGRRGSSLFGNVVRRHLGLPTEEEYRGYLLCTLYSLFHADTLYVTRAVECCGRATEAPILARYLEVLLECFSAMPKTDGKTEVVSSVSTDDRGFDIYIPNPDIDFRGRVLSSLTADAIEMLMTNPYAFYARYILGITPYREVSTGYVANGFNSLVRRVLLQYLKRVGSGTDSDVLIDTARREFAVVSRNYPYVEKFWWPRFEKIAESFFQIDKVRKQSLSEIIVERDFSWKIKDKISVLSRCDTVAYMRDGHVSIVRYTVGSVPSQVDMRCGQAPRGIVESICVGQNIDIEKINFAYWKVTPESVEITEIKDFATIAREAKEGIENLLIRYLEEMTPFNVSDNFPKFAEYELLSRVKERVFSVR